MGLFKRQPTKKCPRCNGKKEVTGKSWSSKVRYTITCPMCEGKGKVKIGPIAAGGK